nr:O-antigen ligase family protein [Aeromonas veronii]
MSSEVKILSYIFISFFVIQAVSIWIDGGALKELDRPSRLLMAAMTLPLLSVFPININVLIAGLSIGAVSSGLIAIYEKFYLGMPRAFDESMPIQSGNISMTLALLCLCAFFWFRHLGKKNIAAFMLLSFLMGGIGSFLSGTRGGWVLLPIVLFTIVFYFRKQLSLKDGLYASTVCALLLFLAMLPQSGVMDRIYNAKADVVHYFDGVNPDTSLGIRLQLWESAYNSFLEKPIFGWGNNGIRLSQLNQYNNGSISEFIYNFNSHAHNQFLDELAKRGIIGFLMLALLYFYPLWVASKNRDNLLVSSMLAVSSLTLVDYSLSQAFISHNSGMIFFMFLFSALITTIKVSPLEGRK